MKQINKEKFDKRIKNAIYMLTGRYDQKKNNNTLSVMRNGRVMMPKDLTDEDIIILSQIADGLSNTFHMELCQRDLVPEEFKKAFNKGKAEYEETLKPLGEA